MVNSAQPLVNDTDPMLDVALSYQAQNWPVFPCRHRDDEYVDQDGCIEILATKTPLTSNGFRGATLNERIVREYWRRNPSAMIGVPTGAPIGAWVLDIDPKHGGDETLAALELTHGALPATLTAETTSGGRHYFFRHRQGVRNRGALGSGVDVRGDGGYVIAAGSVPEVGLPYRWISEQEPVDAPDWLLELVLPRSYESTYTAAPSVSGKINDRYVERAVQSELDDLALEPMGNRNNRLNDAAFRLGTFVGAGALAESEARALLQDVARGWGRDWPRCVKTIDNGLAAGARSPRTVPQNDNDNTRLVDISRMIANGLAKAKTESSHDSIQPEGESEATEEHEPPAPKNKPAFVATPFEWINPVDLKRREFAFGTHYIRKYVSVTVSPGGIGKTSNSIVEALSMASGRILTGDKPQSQLKCWIFNAEDPRDEMERRIMAACIHYNMKKEDFEGRLFVDTGREQELVIMHEDKKTGVSINEPIVEAVVEQIQRNGIDVMIVDPFVSTHRVNENDNGAIDRVAKLWAQIADYTNCAVDVVHHLRKQQDGREATVEDARGAVSLIGAARSVRVLNRMTDEQARQASLDPGDRFSYFNIHQGKANLSKIDNSQHWRKLESVALGNGQGPTKPQDFSGVVTEWKWPSKDEIAEAVPADVKQMVLVKLENQNYRESDQSSDWAGYVLASAMGVDIEAGKKMTADKRKIKAVLDSWISNGILTVVKEPDPKHLDRTISYVRAA